MSAYLNISEKRVIEQYYGELSADRSKWESIDSKRNPCPFLRSTCAGYYCEIYPARPEGCRVYPMESVGGRFCPRWEIAISKLKKEQEEEIQEGLTSKEERLEEIKRVHASMTEGEK